MIAGISVINDNIVRIKVPGTIVLNINGKTILLLDQWHFSATRRSEQEIFDGISDAWKNFVEKTGRP